LPVFFFFFFLTSLSKANLEVDTQGSAWTMAANASDNSCHACGKSGGKLLRCGRCRDVWFCDRQCQVAAAKQGHSGANCCAADGAHAPKAAEVAPRVPNADGRSITAPGVDSIALAPAAHSCHACGKNDGKLRRCGRCRNVWFCNRECQVAAARQGHSGANCRPADGVQRSPSSVEKLKLGFKELMTKARKSSMTNSRLGQLAAVEDLKAAGAVAGRIGGADGATMQVDAFQMLAHTLVGLEDMAEAARTACSSLLAARASGSRTMLVRALTICGAVAIRAPDEAGRAERESREQERLNCPPSYGGLDLSQEGRISLPSTPAAFSRLGLAYNEAAVGICDAALAEAGGRGSPASLDTCRVPSLRVEAEARGNLGTCLHDTDGDPRPSLELIRQAVAVVRQVVRGATPGEVALQAKRGLATQLSNLASIQNELHQTPGYEDAGNSLACLREALVLCEETDDVHLQQAVLINLSNMSCRPDQPVGLVEAAALRARLNALYAKNGRSPDTSCAVCLEPLEQPDGGIRADGCPNSAVQALRCSHQLHARCLSTWWETRSDMACPVCKKSC